MAKKLYVGNLPYNTNDAGLRDVFSKVGEVISAVVMVDKVTGRSRGFGFVEMNDQDIEKAISALNGQQLDGRELTVNEARPMTERPRREFNNRQSF